MKAHQIAPFYVTKPRLETALEIAGAKCYVSEAWVKVRGNLVGFCPCFFLFLFWGEDDWSKNVVSFFLLEKKGA